MFYATPFDQCIHCAGLRKIAANTSAVKREWNDVIIAHFDEAQQKTLHVTDTSNITCCVRFKTDTIDRPSSERSGALWPLRKIATTPGHLAWLSTTVNVDYIFRPALDAHSPMCHLCCRCHSWKQTLWTASILFCWQTLKAGHHTDNDLMASGLSWQNRWAKTKCDKHWGWQTLRSTQHG